ncbi:hypothetical protein [Azospirillum lipoferum]|uniref:DoxX family protein n=1 Tax=Azospirillum lipoferum (strain 4B) TaxID=862719 RepID=G7Z795_AZOL4|nr:hypothetical protein [Azospirillum lipoferum]CBS86771.1 protein of unknown function [Azospirillum lipoferum 4B]
MPVECSAAFHRLTSLGALAGLTAMKLVMLGSMFSRTPPFPPLEFAPLFAASIGLAALCAALIVAGSRWFGPAAVLLALESLLSYGPHKFYPGESSFFAQTAAVYPVLAIGTLLIAVFAASGWALFHSMGGGK